MLKIVGIQRKSGTFQNREYDNINFHVLNDSPSTPTICGYTCEIIKVKRANIQQVFSGLISNDSDYRGLIGMALVPYFDRYANVIRAEITDYIERG